MISVYDALLLFMLQGVLIILAVIVGGYLVYRTKRETYESFFPAKEQVSTSFNIAEEGHILPTEKEPELPSVIKRMNEQFIKQTGAAE